MLKRLRADAGLDEPTGKLSRRSAADSEDEQDESSDDGYSDAEEEVPEGEEQAADDAEGDSGDSDAEGDDNDEQAGGDFDDLHDSYAPVSLLDAEGNPLEIDFTKADAPVPKPKRLPYEGKFECQICPDTHMYSQADVDKHTTSKKHLHRERKLQNAQRQKERADWTPEDIQRARDKNRAKHEKYLERKRPEVLQKRAEKRKLKNAKRNAKRQRKEAGVDGSAADGNESKEEPAAETTALKAAEPELTKIAVDSTQPSTQKTPKPRAVHPKKVKSSPPATAEADAPAATKATVKQIAATNATEQPKSADKLSPLDLLRKQRKEQRKKAGAFKPNSVKASGDAPPQTDRRRTPRTTGASKPHAARGTSGGSRHSERRPMARR